MGNQVLGTDKILRMNDMDLLGLVQSQEWAPNLNAQDIFELGRETKLATALELETSGSIEMLSAGGLAGFLARMVVQRNGSGVVTGYMYDAAGPNGRNGYTLTQNDLREMSFDLVVHEKPDQLTFTRSVVLPRCYPTSIAGRAEAGGEASETLNWAGEFVIGAVTPYHDVRTIPCTVAAGQLVLEDATVTSVNWTLMYAYVDERQLTTDNTQPVWAEFDNTPAPIAEVTVTGMTVPANALCRVVVYRTTPQTTFPSLLDANRATTARFVRGWQSDIFIAPADALNPTQAEKWLKLQSVDWNIDFRSETLRQIALNRSGTAVYCRVPTFPLDISLNASVLEADWLDWRALLNKTFTGVVYNNTYDFAPNSLKDQFAVVIRTYTKGMTLLQTLRFTDMRVDSMSQRAAVGGRSEVSWGFRGTAFALVGANA